MEQNINLKGLYYIFKQQNIILYNLNKESFSPSYIYAVRHDIYPFFNETEESEYFCSCYKISKEFIEKILSKLGTIDDKFLENYRINLSTEEAKEKLPSYWEFLDILGIKRHSDEDYNVYQVLRYIFLENDNFTEILEHFIKRENCPIEYQGLTKPFDENKSVISKENV